MCGIAGIVDLAGREPIDRDALARMNASLAHRGPDEEGSWAEGPVGLAMRRLSIIDLSTGKQPIANEDGTIRVVFNGEIYGYQALRDELIAKGHVLRTQSDTEVIVHLYEEHGLGFVKRLRGMFAIALWDEPRGRLVLARDRLGKKPLVHAVAGGKLVFASEIPALLQHPGISRELDPVALDLFLGLQYVPSPRSVFRHVRKLPAAHLLVAEKGEIRVERYWEPPRDRPLLDLGEEEAAHAVREKVIEATRLRMVAERPVGAFLSGGIDSSIVVAAMASLSPRPVRTFSIGFEEESYSELPFAREVARRHGTEHVEFIVRADMADALPRIAAQHGEPYADPSALPTWYLTRETRQHVIVALNGDGGDEAFVGYRRYAGMKLASLWDRVPAPGRSLARALARGLPAGSRGPLGKARRLVEALSDGGEARRYLRMVGFIAPDMRSSLTSPAFRAALGDEAGADVRFMEALFARGAGLDLLRRLQLVDMESYLPDCLMPKVDIASMAHSLECRSPLLDHELVELAFRLAPSLKLRGIRGSKWILRRAFRDDLPASVLARGKMGFGIPLAEWFRGPLRATWETTVLSPEALRRGLFDEAALRRILAEHGSGSRDHGFRMWALLMLETWFRTSLPDGGLS